MINLIQRFFKKHGFCKSKFPLLTGWDREMLPSDQDNDYF